MVRKSLLGTLAATGMAAGSLFFAAPASAEAASAAASVPGCVDVYLGNNVVYKYAKVANNCSYDVDGVRTIINPGREGPCFYLSPGETRIDRYGPQAQFQRLASC